MGRIINTTSANLKSYKRSQLEKVKNAIADTAVAIELEATRKAPNFIKIGKKFFNKGFKAEISVKGKNKIAAYFEFGTGLSAASILAPYPQYVKDVAMAFYETGKGTLKGKPYFYPAVFRNETILQKELKTISDENVTDK